MSQCVAFQCIDGIYQMPLSQVKILLSDVYDVVDHTQTDEIINLTKIGKYNIKCEHLQVIDNMMTNPSYIFTYEKFYMKQYYYTNKVWHLRDIYKCMLICDLFNIGHLLIMFSILYLSFSGRMKQKRTNRTDDISDAITGTYNIISDGEDGRKRIKIVNELNDTIQSAKHILNELRIEEYCGHQTIRESYHKTMEKRYIQSMTPQDEKIFWTHFMLSQSPELIKSLANPTPDVWLTTIKYNPYYFKDMPSAMINERILSTMSGYSLDRLRLEYPEMITTDHLKMYILNGGYLEQIPKQLLTKQLIYYAIHNTPFNHIDFDKIPYDLIDDQIIDKYLNCKRMNKQIPTQFMNERRCNIIVKSRKSLTNIPEQLMTRQMVYYYLGYASKMEPLVVAGQHNNQYNKIYEYKHNYSLTYIPKHLYDEKLCNKMLQIYGKDIIRYFPVEILTLEYCLNLIQTRDDYNACVLHIPFDIQNNRTFIKKMKTLMNDTHSYYVKVYKRNDGTIYTTYQIDQDDLFDDYFW